MTFGLARAAAWEQGHQRRAFRDSKAPSQLGTAGRRLHQPSERMKNISSFYTVACEEFRLEGEDAKQLVDSAAHQGQSALAPGPDLGRHQVEHGNSELFQPASHT